MNILSLQSWVAYGHVGNAAAVFPLQRLGAEVWAIHTVQFSNHTGYGSWTGQVFDGAAVTALVDGIAARGVLARCDAVLSGYLGDEGIGLAVRDTVARVRAANPQALYGCDPVLGDIGRGLYVRPGIPALMRGQILPQADLLTPNLFELSYLTGHADVTLGTLATVKQAVRTLQAGMRAEGPAAVLVTSLLTEETPEDSLDLLACDRDACYRIRAPRLPRNFNGAGDLIAALFLFHYHATGRVAEAAMRAAAAVHGVLSRTLAAGAAELLTVAAQAEFVRPSRHFPAVMV